MKYQAPVDLTEISCAGETFAPDDKGGFEAAEGLADALSAHGCVPAADPEATVAARADELRPRARVRAEKAQ